LPEVFPAVKKCQSLLWHFFMSMEGRYAENAGAIFWRCPWKDGTVKQGFRNANSLAFRLMNAIRSANGKMQVPGTTYVVPGAFSAMSMEGSVYRNNSGTGDTATGTSAGCG